MQRSPGMARIGKARLNPQIDPDDLPNKVYLRPRELAAFLGVAPKTVYSWCRLKRIVAIKPKSLVYILRESVLKCMRNGKR
jgi:hypothetical protein